MFGMVTTLMVFPTKEDKDAVLKASIDQYPAPDGMTLVASRTDRPAPGAPRRPRRRASLKLLLATDLSEACGCDRSGLRARDAPRASLLVVSVIDPGSLQLPGAASGPGWTRCASAARSRRRPWSSAAAARAWRSRSSSGRGSRRHDRLGGRGRARGHGPRGQPRPRRGGPPVPGQRVRARRPARPVPGPRGQAEGDRAALGTQSWQSPRTHGPASRPPPPRRPRIRRAAGRPGMRTCAHRVPPLAVGLPGWQPIRSRPFCMVGAMNARHLRAPCCRLRRPQPAEDARVFAEQQRSPEARRPTVDDLERRYLALHEGDREAAARNLAVDLIMAEARSLRARPVPGPATTRRLRRAPSRRVASSASRCTMRARSTTTRWSTPSAARCRGRSASGGTPDLALRGRGPHDPPRRVPGTTATALLRVHALGVQLLAHQAQLLGGGRRRHRQVGLIFGSQAIVARTSSSVAPGCRKSRRISPVSSKCQMPRSVTTTERPAPVPAARLADPLGLLGAAEVAGRGPEVDLARRRARDWRMITNTCFALIAISQAPPEPGSRVFGAS